MESVSCGATVTDRRHDPRDSLGAYRLQIGVSLLVLDSSRFSIHEHHRRFDSVQSSEYHKAVYGGVWGNHDSFLCDFEKENGKAIPGSGGTRTSMEVD